MENLNQGNEPVAFLPIMLLVQKVHYTFEMWFIRQFQLGLLPDYFSIGDMRKEYLNLCWKEEYMWKKWSEDVN